MRNGPPYDPAVDVPSGYRRVLDGDAFGVVRDGLADLPLAEFWAEGEPLTGVRGRGAVAVLRLRDQVGVARRYRRGGAFRGILPDAFLDSGRATRELVVLAALRQAGVPVVEPLAAVTRRRGLLYEHRLITGLFEGARPLPAFAAAEPALANAAVREAGRVVAAAFACGLRHPDLHPDNLIVAHDGRRLRVRMIDLDQASLRAPLAPQERDRMLLRMARYLERHAEALPVADRRVDHLRFLAGMGLDRTARRTALGRLRPLYARAVVRHRASWGGSVSRPAVL